MEKLSDKELLTLPPPTGLIFCRVFMIRTIVGRMNGYERCIRCSDYIPCIRYIEAELWSEGIEIQRSKFDKKKEEKAMERYLHSVGYSPQGKK